MGSFQVYYSKSFLFFARYIVPFISLAVTIFLIRGVIYSPDTESMTSRIILIFCSIISLVVAFFFSRAFFNKELISRKYMVGDEGFTHTYSGFETKVKWEEINYFTLTVKLMYLIQLKNGEALMLDGHMKKSSALVSRMKLKGIRLKL